MSSQALGLSREIYALIPMGRRRVMLSPELTRCRSIEGYIEPPRRPGVVPGAETLLHAFGRALFKTYVAIDSARHTETEQAHICLAIAKPLQFPPDFDAIAAHSDGSREFLHSDRVFALLATPGIPYLADRLAGCIRHDIDIF